MTDLLKFLLPVFLFPTDYSEMMKKLASLLFWETYIVTFFLRELPEIDQTLSALETYGKIGEALSSFENYGSFNFAGIAISIIVAGLAYIFHLHDRVSDLFKIRHRFDLACILRPLAELTGATLSETQLDKLSANRHPMMRKVFYKYTSSKANYPLVDKHDIHHALNAWSWYWMFIEAAVLLLAAAILCLSLGAKHFAFGFGLLLVGDLVLGRIQYSRLHLYARPQIDSIAADGRAAAAVKREFDAL